MLAIPQQMREINQLVGHTGHVQTVKFNRTGEYILSGGWDRMIYLWNPYRQLRLQSFEGHGYQVVDVAIVNDNQKFASCGGDKTPFLWDVEKAKVIRKFRGHDQRINCVEFNNDTDCTILASGSYDSLVKLWDMRSNSFDAIDTLDEGTDSISSIKILNYEIFTGSIDGRVRCYDMRVGKIRIDQISRPVTSVNLSHDGNILLVSTLDSTIRLVDKDDGDLYSEYTGHVNIEYPITSLFTNNDAFVVSGSEDGRLCWWSLEEEQMIHEIRAHEERINCVTHHPKENYIITASSDKSIKLWGTS